MKTVIFFLTIFALNAIAFVHGNDYYNLIAWFNWSAALFSVLCVMFCAATYKKKLYRFLVSYFYAEGNGRAFISCNQKHADEKLILEFEKQIAKHLGFKGVLAISVQNVGVES
ncbi:hypothetical protein [Acinetobacter rudis]|uniref:hypothetical protein n=1 Tax=Acinetobacter rudis TaxID=632955 RepID=UPI00333FA3E5